MTKTEKTKAKKAGSAKARTKGEQIVAMLRRPTGASIAELIKATGWQAHSVRGFLSGSLKKKRNIEVSSNMTDGTRRYLIARGGAEA